MFHAASLLSYLLLALSVTDSFGSPAASAQPGIISLPIKAPRVAIAERVKRDARSADSKGSLDKRQDNLADLANDGAFTGFTTQVGIGSPATQYTLLVDISHPNTWVGAGKAYSRTSTSVNKGTRVSVTYAQGSFSGTVFTDKVSLSTSAVVGGREVVATGQQVDVAATFSGFEGFDGVLGLAPGQSSLATVMDTLYSQGTISEKQFGITLGINQANEATSFGIMTVGGIDDSNYFGDLEYVTRLTAAPYNTLWAVTTTISYGGAQLVAEVASTIDSLNPYIFLPTAAYNSYVTSTGATLDTATGLLKIAFSAGATLQNLDIQWGGTGGTYHLSPDAQVWPYFANLEIGGDLEHYYLVIKDGGASATLGLPFMERFYLAFDAGASQVGIANSVYGTDKISIPPRLPVGGVCNYDDANYCPPNYRCWGDDQMGHFNYGTCQLMAEVSGQELCFDGTNWYGPCYAGYTCTWWTSTEYYCEIDGA